MTPEQEIQWYEEFNQWFKSSLIVDRNLWDSYIEARKKAQEDINALASQNNRLSDFCNEFVYGEENPEYYSTMTDKLKERDKEVSQLKEEFEKLHSFCLNYQIYIHDILHSVNVFKSFHDLRKGAHAYAVSMDKDPKWDYQDTENTDYFNGLKSYVVQLKEQIASAKEIKQYPTALTYISELKEELRRERETIDSLIKKHEDVGINQYDIYYARQTQQQRKVEL